MLKALNTKDQLIFDRAFDRARNYVFSEAKLLESILEIDREKIFKRFGEVYLTPFCVKYLMLSDAVAENFVRVARKSRLVPELGLAVLNGRLDLSKAKVIASVVTRENSAVWIDKAASLSKAKLEREVVAANPKMSKPEKCQPVNATHVRVECEITHHENDRFRRAQEVLNSFSVAETLFKRLIASLNIKTRSRKRNGPGDGQTLRFGLS